MRFFIVKDKWGNLLCSILYVWFLLKDEWDCLKCVDVICKNSF